MTNTDNAKWVGGVSDSQTRSNPQINPKIVFFDPNFTFGVPKSHKIPGVGGWVHRFGKTFPKKTFYFLGASLMQNNSLIDSLPTWPGGDRQVPSPRLGIT